MLQQRSVRAGSANLNIGDMVVLREDNLPPLQWQLGRVIWLHLGEDVVVRVVSVKTPSGITKRAVSRLAFLPVEQQQDIV